MASTVRNWAAVIGQFDFSGDDILFHGGSKKYADEPGPALGTALCDQWFSGGTIKAKIKFHDVEPRSACDIILFYNPSTREFFSAGLSNEMLYSIRSFDTRWTTYNGTGDAGVLRPGVEYQIECRVRGSKITLLSDGVEVAAANLPAALPRSQVGIWCRSQHDITVSDYVVSTEAPRAFIVMQFSSPYNELYNEVVKPICTSLGVDAVRADETYGPGLIIADVIRQIEEANVIIAEITPANPNVYYEVGYAHARGKPTILIADRQVDKLPFDVSPFRTLFYENSIDGKRRVEEGLLRHLKSVLDPSNVFTAGQP